MPRTNYYYTTQKYIIKTVIIVQCIWLCVEQNEHISVFNKQILGSLAPVFCALIIKLICGRACEGHFSIIL